jgi:peptide/nickel transport system substrate-binding protein
MRKLILFCLIAILAASLVMTGCNNSSTTTATSTTTKVTTSPTTVTPSTSVSTATTTAKKSGGILTFISPEVPSGALGVPSKWGGLNSLYVAGTYERMLIFDNAGNVIPWLATDYKWSNNNLTLTLTLRKGVKFHDGTDFNADAALWNIQQAIDAKGSLAKNVDTTSKVDDYTIQINLKKYQNTWFSSFCGLQGGGFMMFSPTAYKVKGQTYAEQNPIGTGPFKFDAYVSNTSLSFSRFDGYWGPKPYIDGYKYLIVADAVTSELSFQAGDGDAIINISNPNQLVKDLTAKGYKYTNWPGMPWSLIPSSGTSPSTINTDSPWSNLKVRQAADYAIDKAAICKSVFYGYSQPLAWEVTSWMLPYDPNFKGNEYNVDKAKQLMIEAGYPNGFKTTLLVPEQMSGAAETIIQANFKAIGIEAEIQIVSVGKWIDEETNGFLEGIEITAQASNCPFDASVNMFWQRPAVPSWGSSGCYWSVYRPPEMDALVAACLSAESNTPANKAADTALAKYMFDNMLVIPLWAGQGAIVLKDYVNDLNYYTNFKTVSGCWNYTGVWLNK